MKIWVNESRFVNIQDNRTALNDEFAPRSRSVDWLGVFGFLPDPDEVLAKLGLDLTVYLQLLTDAHVGACYLSRKSGALSCEWEIREPADNPKRVNTRVMDAVVGLMEDIDIYQVITDLLEAPFFGIAPCEVVWRTASGLWVPDRVAGKPPEWFGFTEDNEMRFISKANMVEGEPLPPYRFITARHHASYRNPYGDRLLSRCFWPVTFKRGGWKFWSIFSEKYGMPWVVGRVPRSTNETERGALLAHLASMVQDACAVINNDESVEIMEAGGKSASADIYDKLISAANRDISKAILGQTLTTELDQGGSYAATKSHMEVRADLVDQDKRMVKGCLDELISWVVELNFSGAEPPEFTWLEDEDIQADRAERDAKLKDQGVRFTKIYYQRRYNFEEDEIEVTEPTEENPLQNDFDRSNLRFAETRKFTPDQQALEDLVDDSLSKAAEAREAVSAAIIEAVQSATSYEDLQERLAATVADRVPAADFEEILARVLTAAHMWGRAQKR